MLLTKSITFWSPATFKLFPVSSQIPSPALTIRIASRPLLRRPFSHTSRLSHPASNMEVELSAPNGKKWTQPLGLFINNEFVASSNDSKIASINPA